MGRGGRGRGRVKEGPEFDGGVGEFLREEEGGEKEERKLKGEGEKERKKEREREKEREKMKH